MTYKRAFLLTLTAYLASLAVYLLTDGEAEPPTEKQTVIATQPGEGKARGEESENKDYTILKDTSEASPKTGGNNENNTT